MAEPDDVIETPIWMNLSRVGERVASLERDVANIKSDSEVIRHTLHEVNGKMQLFVIAEQGCVAALREIKGALQDHTVSINALTIARERAYGIWWAIVRVCAVVSGGFMVIGSVFAGIAWMLEHHVEFLVK